MILAYTECYNFGNLGLYVNSLADVNAQALPGFLLRGWSQVLTT